MIMHKSLFRCNLKLAFFTNFFLRDKGIASQRAGQTKINSYCAAKWIQYCAKVR
jgi:hypothetical protein